MVVIINLNLGLIVCIYEFARRMCLYDVSLIQVIPTPRNNSPSDVHIII